MGRRMNQRELTKRVEQIRKQLTEVAESITTDRIGIDREYILGDTYGYLYDLQQKERTEKTDRVCVPAWFAEHETEEEE